MKCAKCDKEATYYMYKENLCDDCWDDWWFEGYSEADRIEARPFLFVCRAYRDLGLDATNDQILYHVMQNLSRGSVNPNAVKKAIEEYRAFEQDPGRK